MSGSTGWGFVTSADGTRIGYEQVGDGPGLVVLHGAMESAGSHRDLAEQLAADHTVYLVDRRGRGRSGPFGPDHSLQRELEDLEALLDDTGAPYVLGVSVGAVVALAAAVRLDQVRKVVLFEPPFAVGDSISPGVVERLDREVAAGRTAAAMVTAMLGAQLGPAALRVLPRPLLVLITAAMLRSEDRRAGPDDLTMRKLAATVPYDFHVVEETRGRLADYGDVPADVLLLGGSRSPTYLKTALGALSELLPGATRVEIPGVSHEGSGNRDSGGDPEAVAGPVRRFLAEAPGQG